MVLYEYPFNEKIRFFLRLEDLFGRLQYFIDQADPRQHQVALSILFDILDVTQRSDIKSDLMNELDKQKQGLQALRAHPNVDDELLQGMLSNIDRVIRGLSSNLGKVGQELRTHEWLNAVRSRSSIPGGMCMFDLPTYFIWQQRSADARRHDLLTWAQPFLVLKEAVDLLLRLIRECGHTSSKIAHQGSYQEMLGGKSFQLLRLNIPNEKSVFPEISANKYLISIRFFLQSADLTSVALTQEMPFDITLCQSLSPL